MDEEKEILHKYWSDDRKRMAHVVYDKEFDGFEIRCTKTIKKLNQFLCPQAQFRHSEQYAEDAAENWVMGY